MAAYTHALKTYPTRKQDINLRLQVLGCLVAFVPGLTVPLIGCIVHVSFYPCGRKERE